MAVAMTLGSPAPPGFAQPQVSDVDRQIAAASQRLETLIERYDASRADLRATEIQIRAIRARLSQLNDQLSSEQDRISAVVVWAYKTGPASEASAILGADSPAALIDRLATIELLARVQDAKVNATADLGRQLETRQRTLQTLADQQTRQETDLRSLTSQVEKDLAGLRDLRARVQTASRAVAPIGSAPKPPPAMTRGPLGRVLLYAYAQLGRPYQYGAAGPGSFDCSGLTMAAWRIAGTELPHNAARQYGVLPHLARAQLRPGDLVFYYWDIHHVALYVGRGWVIHAPAPGEPVRLAPMDLAPIHGYARPT